jgi:hypothetical protein
MKSPGRIPGDFPNQNFLYFDKQVIIFVFEEKEENKDFQPQVSKDNYLLLLRKLEGFL